MDTFLHVTAADEQQRKIAQRQAAIIAASRYQETLHSFVSAATDEEDLESRLHLVEDEIREFAVEACNRTGSEEVSPIVESIVLTARQHFADKDSTNESESDTMDRKPWETEEDEKDSDNEDEKVDAKASHVVAGTPSPKMDKRKWTPRNLGELPKDKADGPNPTERQDVNDHASPVNTSEEGHGLKNIGEGVTERQKVDQDHENIRGPHTKTFPKGNQANPVTAAQDVNKNPLREILDRENGFLSQPEVDRAISLHNAQ